MSKTTKYILIGAVAILVFLRLHMGITRFFDSDEMSHMHWAWLVSRGDVPFRDFFYYNLPGYQYVILWPFFLPASSGILIITRLWQFLMYLATVVLLYRFTKRLTNSSVIGLLSSVIFLAFPMTFDKTIDIRPDMTMMLFYLAALELTLTTKIWSQSRAFFLGFLIALSIGVTLKTIVFALPALLFVFFTNKPKPSPIQTITALSGIILPALVYFLYLTVTDALIPAITMITKDAFAVNAGKGTFSPWKALSPYPLVYLAEGGVSLPWIINTGIWILSVVGFIKLILTKKSKSAFLVIYFFFGIIFLFLFPAPYLQYFLPLSVFVSVLAAIAIQKYQSAPLAFVVCALLVSSFFIQYKERTGIKNSNAEQLSVISSTLEMSRPNETFYDMVGSYIFRPDGFILCCHPYNEFADRLSTQVPALRDSLIERETKFIVMDRTAIVFWYPYPQDLTFLKSHYFVSEKNWKIYLHGYRFGCMDGKCTQYDIEDTPVSPASSFYIIGADTYRVTVTPQNQTVAIDGVSYGNSATVPLSKGNHTFTADPAVTSWTIQLNR